MTIIENPNLNIQIEESTNRIVEALDRLTIATMAGKSESSLDWATEKLNKMKEVSNGR